MPVLDLYKNRRSSTIKLADGVEYQIPSELSVEETERLYELQVIRESKENEEVVDAALQSRELMQVVFDQLEVIFQHYTPTVTSEYLKKTVTHTEALEMIGFFQKYRNLATKTQDDTESKKKSKSAVVELRELRRIITFLVVSGFSLFELRKLYIDELYDFYDHLFYTLEQTGKIKQGTYDKLNRGKNNDGNAVTQLRTQLFKVTSDKK